MNTGWAIVKSMYHVGIPAMLGFGDTNVLAFIAMEITLLYFFIFMIIIGKVSILLKMWDKFIVGPLKGVSSFLDNLVSEDTHFITRDTLRLVRDIAGGTSKVLRRLPRLGVVKLWSLMSALMALRAGLFGAQLATACAKGLVNAAAATGLVDSGLVNAAAAVNPD